MGTTNLTAPGVEEILLSWEAATVFEKLAGDLQVSLAVADSEGQVLVAYGPPAPLAVGDSAIALRSAGDPRVSVRDVTRYNQAVGTVIGTAEGGRTPLLDRLVNLLASCLEDKAGSLIEMNGLSQELLHVYEEMNFFHTFAQTMAGFVKQENTCQLVLDKVMDLIPARRGAIFLPEKHTGRLELAAEVGDQKWGARLTMAASCTLDQVFTSARSLLVENADDFAREVRRDMEELEATSMLAVPLTVPTEGKPRASGVLLLLDRVDGDSFGSPELKIAEAAAGQVGVVLNIVMLLELEQEFQLARDIQSVLLPSSLPERPGLGLAGRCVAARNIGGDYYDVIEVGENEIGLVVADVSGHNIASGLLMAVGRTIFRTDATRRSQPSPGEVLTSMNRKLFEDLSRAEKFISAFYLRYDPGTLALMYANAGHNRPFLWRAQRQAFEVLEGDGMLLGILPEQVIQDETTRLEAGDVLVVYTDGVVEAKNKRGEFLGEERFQDVIREHVHLHPDDLVEAIFRHLKVWAEGADQSDDITVVVLATPPARVIADVDSTQTEPRKA